MKKKETSVFYGGVSCYLLLLFFFNGFGQNTTLVTGVVFDHQSDMPLNGVTVELVGKQINCLSNTNGEFVLKNTLSGSCQISFYGEGYVKKIYPINLTDSLSIDMGRVFLSIDREEIQELQTIVLDDDDLIENDIGGANVITGLLQSSKDVFLRTAAFNFGPARFRIRGYDSKEGMVLFNGIKMNKIQTGRPQWSNWGGLNDVLRNGTFTSGLASIPFTFGSLLGTTNFTTRASEYRAGTGVSFASANGSYNGRIMATHFTGVLRDGWAFAFSASSRFAQNGTVEGVTYKAYSGFFAAEKMLSKNHSINLTAVYAFNRRGKSSPNTQEVIDLRGPTYNSYWGLQEGVKRNSRVQEIEEPLLMLSHYWQVKPETFLTTSVSYQFGHVGASRLGYDNVDNPDPTYYKKLPSYFFQGTTNYSNAFIAQKSFQVDGQIDWTAVYQTNALTKTASYYLFEDRNEDRQLSINTVLNKTISKRIKLDAGVAYRKLNSLNYAQVLDVFGANSFLDIDSYEEGEKSQSNLNNKNREVSVGDDFSYKYQISFSEFYSFLQIAYQFEKLELSGAVDFSSTSYQRKGLFKNGAYPENSYNKGSSQVFSDFSFKLNGLYTFSGRHLLYGTAALVSRAPTLKNVYRNIRVQHSPTPNISSENIAAFDLNYQYRSPKLKARFTAYYTLFSDVTENSFLYAQGLKGDDADFIAQLVTGIKKQHIGIELGIDLELTSTVSLTAVAAIGQYTYHNNPNLYVETDLYSEKESDFGTVYLKGYKLGGTPQRAFSLGINYRDPNYWWVAINGNLLTHHYLSISPLLRTSNFYTDTDGVPFVDEETGKQVTQNQISELLEQERFDDLVLVNLVGGKSWKLKENYLGVFMSLNNLFDAIYKTGGFEQSRKANYKELKEDKSLDTPLFGPKYWMQNGSSYYLIVSYRF